MNLLNYFLLGIVAVTIVTIVVFRFAGQNQPAAAPAAAGSTRRIPYLFLILRRFTPPKWFWILSALLLIGVLTYHFIPTELWNSFSKHMQGRWHLLPIYIGFGIFIMILAIGSWRGSGGYGAIFVSNWLFYPLVVLIFLPALFLGGVMLWAYGTEGAGNKHDEIRSEFVEVIDQAIPKISDTIIRLGEPKPNKQKPTDSSKESSESGKTASGSTERDANVIKEFPMTLAALETSPAYEQPRGTCPNVKFPDDARRPGEDAFDLEFTGHNYDKWISAEDYAFMSRQGQAPFRHNTDFRVRNKTDEPIALIVQLKRFGTCGEN